MFLKNAVAVGSISIMGIVAAQTSPLVKQDAMVRMNQVQVIGSHNSYHSGFAPSAAKVFSEKNLKAYESLEYKHAPLNDQLTGGVRQLEIDIFSDSHGGLFARPKIDLWVKEAGLPADPDFDPGHEMDKPGFKVMHVQDLDERSPCHAFVKCLETVKTWSKANPGHLPVYLLIETKEGDVKGMPEAVKTEPFTPATFDAVDAEIRSVFQESEMITPDQVRGQYPTLNAAVMAGKWPTLAEARGKIVFLMDQRKAESVYVDGHPSLKGRVMFTNAVPGAPDAAFTEENDGSKATIDALVKQGYIVRTRTDESTIAARTNNTTRRDLALSTGAQLISTDYPSSEPSEWTGYFVGLPGDLVGRCNPVNAPAGCKSELLEGTTSKK